MGRSEGGGRGGGGCKRSLGGLREKAGRDVAGVCRWARQPKTRKCIAAPPRRLWRPRRKPAACWRHRHRAPKDGSSRIDRAAVRRLPLSQRRPFSEKLQHNDMSCSIAEASRHALIPRTRVRTKVLPKSHSDRLSATRTARPPTSDNKTVDLKFSIHSDKSCVDARGGLVGSRSHSLPVWASVRRTASNPLWRLAPSVSSQCLTCSALRPAACFQIESNLLQTPVNVPIRLASSEAPTVVSSSLQRSHHVRCLMHSLATC